MVRSLGIVPTASADVLALADNAGSPAIIRVTKSKLGSVSTGRVVGVLDCMLAAGIIELVHGFGS